VSKSKGNNGRSHCVVCHSELSVNVCEEYTKDLLADLILFLICL